MFKKGKIHTEIIKTSKLFPEIFIPIRSYKIQNNLNSNDCTKKILEKIDLFNRHKRRFTPDIKKMKKFNSNDINIDLQKNNRQQSNNIINNQLIKNWHGKNELYKNTCSKSQDKPIKINLVSQKFKIADDFNEKNSNQFLNEKDECLREEILSDKIEEEEDNIHFYAENEKRNINHLLYTKTRKINCNLNSKQIKRKMIKAKLIKELK